MKTATKLKDEARKHEQQEEWDKAIQLYQHVLRGMDDEDSAGESELPLYNRIGDLYVRMGQPADAVKNYEKAADRYAEAGLYNNAIALCNKALRYQPARLALFRKLGQYCAHQGFLTDARRWYLEFAERMFKQGEIDEAFSALEDFAGISDDPDVRLLLGRKLHAHDRLDDALLEFRRALSARTRNGEDEAAEAIRTEARELFPDGPDLSEASESAAGSGFDGDRGDVEGVQDLPTYSDIEAVEVTAEADDTEQEGVVALPAFGAGDEVGEEPTPARIEGFEGTQIHGSDPASVTSGALAGLDTGRDDTLDRMQMSEEGSSPDAEDDAGDRDDADETVSLPLLGESAELPPPLETAQQAPQSQPVPAATMTEDEFVDLAALLAPERDTVETTRFFIKESEPTGDEDHDFAELLNQFRAKLAEHVPEDDAGSHYDLGLAFKDMGLVDDAISEYQIALRAGQDRLKVFEELGQCFILKEQYNIAVKVLTRALQFDRHDDLELIGVYYFLGRAYEELGEASDARDAYERVMGLDIRFEDVQERINGL